MSKIFVFGGSFNPIHIGHLILAQYCSEVFQCPVVFLPTGKPPHKSIEVETNHRLNMLKLAINDNPNFKLCNYEINQNNITYTYKTINYLSKIYNTIYFFVGEDSLFDLHKWKEPQEILKMAYLVYGKRPGYSRDLSNYCQTRNLDYEKIIELDTPIIDISSTKIREMVRNNQSIKYLTIPTVEEYILKNNLYK